VRLRLIDLERRAQPLDPSSLPAGSVVATFRTCVRDLLFLDDDVKAAGIPVVEDGVAYARLVEVVCGLHSPMTGETQVQGQFKTFLESLDSPAHRWLRRLGQQVLTDARVIREAHLRGLGSRTYGSAVRRHAQESARVAIIGAGVLAQEVHEYVAETHAVDVWTRARLQQLRLGPAEAPVAADRTTLVIAAPVDAEAIAIVAAAYPALCRIIDLRAADESTPLPAGVPARTLTDVFADARPTGATRVKVDAARAAAARCGRRFDTREELHPFGWEDLCA
jgi:glutamyl-tRNA reductase